MKPANQEVETIIAQITEYIRSNKDQYYIQEYLDNTTIPATDIMIAVNATPSILFVWFANTTYEVWKMLISYGADPTIVRTRIHKALLYWTWIDIQKIKLLISVGLDVNIQDGYGNTALCYAFCENTLELICVLLEAGADPNVKYYGYIEGTRQLAPYHILAILLERHSHIYSKNSTVYKLFIARVITIIELLIQHGADGSLFFGQLYILKN